MVNGNTYGPKIQANLASAAANPALQQQGGFGTPTIVANGALVNWQDPNWLNAIVAKGQPG